MKANRIDMILLGGLLALSIYFFLNRRSGSNMPSKQEFAVMDSSQVESIIISDARQQVELFRYRDGWRVNGGPAREESIKGIQVLISRIEVAAPVSRSQEGRIKQALKQDGIKVQIGFEDGKMKGYLVFYDSLSASTFMMLEDSDLPFRVSVRGYRNSNLAELFHADYKYWRDNVIFQYFPGEISRVFLQNMHLSGKSFHLARNTEGSFEVAGGLVPESWSVARKDRVYQYLGYFYDLRFETFSNASADILHPDELPDYILNIDLVDGGRTMLKLFPLFHVDEAGVMARDLNRLFAEINGGKDWVIVKYVEIDLLLKEYDYFAEH